MTHDENIQQELINKFKFLEGNIRIARPRRIFVKVPLEQFPSVFEYSVRQMNFNHLCTITGLDYPDNLGFVYHLAQDSGVVLNMETNAPKSNPVIKSVTSYFSSADAYERELVDLFGAKVEGLAPGNRYPLTDDWPKDQHPLRKDWKPSSTNREEGHIHA